MRKYSNPTSAPGRPRAGVLLAPLLALGVAACARLPAAALAPAPVPDQWAVADGATGPAPQAWLEDFDAPAMAQLVRSAMTANYDLRAAAERVAAARARAHIAGAPLQPSAELSTSAARARQVVNGPSTAARTTDRFSLEAAVSWDPDVWGRLAHSARAADLDAAAVQADYQAARLALAADVARAWFGVIEAQQQVRLAARTVDSFARTLAVIEDRYRAGLSTALDVHLARENVATAEQLLLARRRAADAPRRALEVLLGAYPRAAIDVAAELPNISRGVPAGLPAELLQRRPDLAAAQRRLQAAGERVADARKNLLPNLRLTASGGSASEHLRDLLDGDRLIWNLAGGLTQALWQGGRLAAEDDLARAQRRELWARYVQTVLNAFREVETALAAETFFVEQEIAQRRAVTEANTAAALALENYQQGLVDLITLLEAQRRAFNAESTRLATARQRLDNRVALYLALGGDFQAADTAAAP